MELDQQNTVIMHWKKYKKIALLCYTKQINSTIFLCDMFAY